MRYCDDEIGKKNKEKDFKVAHDQQFEATDLNDATCTSIVLDVHM